MFTAQNELYKYLCNATRLNCHPKEITKMCATCRKHHPELYTDKPAEKTEKKKKPPVEKK